MEKLNNFEQVVFKTIIFVLSAVVSPLGSGELFGAAMAVLGVTQKQKQTQLIKHTGRQKGKS